MGAVNRHQKEVMNYVENIVKRKKLACVDTILACERFLKVLENSKYEMKWEKFIEVVSLIEKVFRHIKGEKADGTPLAGSPFVLEPFQKFILANLTGLHLAEDGVRLYTEAYIYMPRKNGKTSMIACIAFALGMMYRKSGSVIYIAGATLQQALESFNFLVENLKNFSGVQIKNSNHAREIKMTLDSVELIIRATVPKDGLNGNVMIFDELHAMKRPDHYDLMKDSTKAFRNKLMLGITTAGLNKFSFNYYHLEKQKRMLRGEIEDERMFAFICKAEENEQGEIDLLDPKEHEKANPNYNVSVMGYDLLNEAKTALENPLAKANFMAKSLNVYVQSYKSYFNIDEFIKSNQQNPYTIKELLKKKLVWYGGADLSKFHDLTAAALVAKDGDKLIVLSHGFFPLEKAIKKQEGKNPVPLYGWAQEGYATLSETAVVNVADIVKWFMDYREMGFNIKQIGFDRKFSQEFYILMKAKGFKMKEENQTALNKSQGFREIERQAKNGTLAYLNNKLYEYCVNNVSAIEGVDDVVKYEKNDPNAHIDLFDASVFATTRLLQDIKTSVNLDAIIKLHKGRKR